jgi:formate-dependent nitrite reductase cytochrome c552 subunit
MVAAFKSEWVAAFNRHSPDSGRLAARIALSGGFDNDKSRIGSAAVGQKQPADCAETVNAPI